MSNTLSAYPSVPQRTKIPLAKAEVGMPQRERAHCPKCIEMPLGRQSDSGVQWRKMLPGYLDHKLKYRNLLHGGGLYGVHELPSRTHD